MAGSSRAAQSAAAASAASASRQRGGARPQRASMRCTVRSVTSMPKRASAASRTAPALHSGASAGADELTACRSASSCAGASARPTPTARPRPFTATAAQPPDTKALWAAMMVGALRPVSSRICGSGRPASRSSTARRRRRFSAWSRNCGSGGAGESLDRCADELTDMKSLTFSDQVDFAVRES
jgi:hypothetical protein